ncbi:MAG: 16S rRNA (guanine(966)-N(2))-methyltransferase RsmD, partial [Clostridia bacterium]|nr:16S rRNA (guanine(966)-N(2))-methyltransferase RsmD [Clostridia bacterium]
MRVIGGKHRGAVLYEFKGQAIRPTSDRAKEAVFNILQFSVKGSKCLDLCCGTGSLGIEALSRGAAEVTFADNARESVELTKKNLAKTGERAEVILSDALVFLGRCRKKFDIVFIDPPYADDVSVKAVELIVKNDLLTDNGVIVFERDKPFGGAAGASVFDLRKYGKAYISLIRKTKKCLFAGTFDPFTTGHADVVKAALKKYDLLYVVIMKNDKKVPMFSLSDRM